MTVSTDQKFEVLENSGSISITGLTPGRKYQVVEVPEENPIKQVAANVSLALQFIKDSIAINPLVDSPEHDALEEVAAQLYRINKRYSALGWHKKSEDFSEDEAIIF